MGLFHALMLDRLGPASGKYTSGMASCFTWSHPVPERGVDATRANKELLMPYKDPEQAKRYNTDYQRVRRAGMPDKATSDLPARVRIKTAEDVRSLLETTLNEVREAEADALVKARCIGYLAGITLKAIETANLEARILYIEEMLKKKEN